MRSCYHIIPEKMICAVLDVWLHRSYTVL